MVVHANICTYRHVLVSARNGLPQAVDGHDPQSLRCMEHGHRVFTFPVAVYTAPIKANPSPA